MYRKFQEILFSFTLIIFLGITFPILEIRAEEINLDNNVGENRLEVEADEAEPDKVESDKIEPNETQKEKLEKTIKDDENNQENLYEKSSELREEQEEFSETNSDNLENEEIINDVYIEENTSDLDKAEPNEKNQTNSQKNSIVEKGNITYYLNTNEEIQYAELKENGKIKQIIQYYEGTKIDSAEKGIHYVFELTNEGYVQKAMKREKDTGRVLKHYEYYPNTIYGEHTKQIQYIFDVDLNNYIMHATKQEGGTGRIITHYQYYPKTTYGEHIKRIQYIFYINSENYLDKAVKRQQGTDKVTTHYKYYPNTTYGTHANQIEDIYYLNDNGYLIKSLKRWQGTDKAAIHYQYYSNTIYGNHLDQIEYAFYLNKNGYLTEAVKAKRGTDKVTTHYQYYPNTVYGKHTNQIQYIFYLNDNGNLAKAVKRQQGTGKITAHYQYYPNTVYGRHTNQIQYIFYLNGNGNLTQAVKRQQGSNKVTTHYQYYPNTVYGRHTNQIQYIFYLNGNGNLTQALKRQQGSDKITTHYQYYPNTVYGKHSKQIQYQFIINQQGYITKAYKLEAGTGKRLYEYRYQANTRYGSHSSRITQIINLNLPNSNIVNPNKVYSYNQMVNDIKALAKSYPDLITYHSIGKSEYGRDIYAVSIGKGKPTAFINGSHHAREWLTTNLNMYMIEEYAKAYYRNEKIIGYDAKSILNGTTLWFVPMVNPDGVTLQQEGLKAFPKSIHSSLIKMNNGSQNFKRWKANAKGIDLNRQYDAGWSLINSPKASSYQNYKGSKPLEAKEAKAIVTFTNKIDPEVTVAYHSTGQILYWNYLQTGANYQRDLGMAKVISKLTGYSLFHPVGRPSGGGYTDWFIQAKKRPGFTPEIAKYVFESNPPLSEFAGAWKENKAIGLYVAQESLRLYNKRK